MSMIQSDEGIERLKEHFIEQYKKISWRDSLYLNFAKRPDPAGPVVAATVDDFMEQNGFKRLNTAWIELSRTAAEQYAQLLLRSEQMNFLESDTDQELCFQLAKLFIEQFGSDARFFTNGVMQFLDEHPVITEGKLAAVFRFPFDKQIEHRIIYRSYNDLTNDPIDQVIFGIVAVDQERLGYLFIESIAG
jgi:hypothetical protein